MQNNLLRLSSALYFLTVLAASSRPYVEMPALDLVARGRGLAGTLVTLRRRSLRVEATSEAMAGASKQTWRREGYKLIALEHAYISQL